MEVSESVMALFSEAASLWSLLCLQKDLLGGIAAAPKREKHRGWGIVWGGGWGVLRKEAWRMFLSLPSPPSPARLSTSSLFRHLFFFFFLHYLSLSPSDAAADASCSFFFLTSVLF